jgi:thiamine biosynthesis lipoprotein
MANPDLDQQIGVHARRWPFNGPDVLRAPLSRPRACLVRRTGVPTHLPQSAGIVGWLFVRCLFCVLLGLGFFLANLEVVLGAAENPSKTLAVTPLKVLGQEGQDRTLEGFVGQRVLMGVRFRITLYAADQKEAEVALEAAFEEIRRLEKIFSDYDPTSETRRFDQAPDQVLFPASSEFFELIRAAEQHNRATDGYFDVTLGRLTKVWRVARREKRLPDSEQLELAKRQIGMEAIRLVPPRQVARDRTVELDFGGIAKGYAADKALELMRTNYGLARALIDASGDLVAGEPPPGKPGWIVGLSKPEGTAGLLQRIYLKRQALASSGDSTQFLQVDRQRWSHLLDPVSGEPIHGQNLTLVLAPSGATADALASAFAVCPEHVFKTIATRYPEVHARRFHRGELESPIQELETSGWKQAIQEILVP